MRPSLLLPIPALLVVVVFFVYPVVDLSAVSFTEPEPGFGNYTALLTDSTTLTILLRTLMVATLVTAVTLVLAYPYAYLMTISGTAVRALLLFLVLLPFWSSLMARTFSWIVLLQPGGIVSTMLPGLAPAAIQAGHHAAENILRANAGEPRQDFRYHDKGQMATIGKHRAIAQAGRMRLSGFIAWLAWLNPNDAISFAASAISALASFKSSAELPISDLSSSLLSMLTTTVFCFFIAFNAWLLWFAGISSTE